MVVGPAADGRPIFHTFVPVGIVLRLSIIICKLDAL